MTECNCTRGYIRSVDGDIDHCDNPECNAKVRIPPMTKPNELHPLALALLTKLEDIQVEAVQGEWGADMSKVRINEPARHIRICKTLYWDGNAQAIATAHNTQPILLSGYRMMLEWLHDNMQSGEMVIFNQSLPTQHLYRNMLNQLNTQYIAICTQLASMSDEGAQDEVNALREALGGE